MKKYIKLFPLMFAMFYLGRLVTLETTCKKKFKEGFETGSFVMEVHFDVPVTPRITDSLYIDIK